MSQTIFCVPYARYQNIPFGFELPRDDPRVSDPTLRKTTSNTTWCQVLELGHDPTSGRVLNRQQGSTDISLRCQNRLVETVQFVITPQVAPQFVTLRGPCGDVRHTKHVCTFVSNESKFAMTSECVMSSPSALCVTLPGHSSHCRHLSLLPASPPGHCQPPYQMCRRSSPAKHNRPLKM